MTPPSLPDSLPSAPLLGEAARLALSLHRARYRAALMNAGLTPETTLRTLGVLTSGLPGEVIELALSFEDGSHLTRRALPAGPIDAGASRVHGLTEQHLQEEAPLARRKLNLEAALNRPAENGHPVTIASWAGSFTLKALLASLGTPLTLDRPLVDVQAILHSADLRYGETLPGGPDDARPPSLSNLCRMLNLPAQDPRQALSSAQLCRQVITQLLL